MVILNIEARDFIAIHPENVHHCLVLQPISLVIQWLTIEVEY
jgi:hypothetical protein